MIKITIHKRLFAQQKERTMFSRATITLHHHLKSGAGEGTRTLDIDLGKVALYQLSYARIKS
jgi:hypothetical protein